MITNKYRCCDFEDCNNKFFIISSSEEEMFKELEDYCLSHKDERVYIGVNPVRPSKVNLRPEYSMEVGINLTGKLIGFQRVYYKWMT